MFTISSQISKFRSENGIWTSHFGAVQDRRQLVTHIRLSNKTEEQKLRVRRKLFFSQMFLTVTWTIMFKMGAKASVPIAASVPVQTVKTDVKTEVGGNAFAGRPVGPWTHEAAPPPKYWSNGEFGVGYTPAMEQLYSVAENVAKGTAPKRFSDMDMGLHYLKKKSLFNDIKLPLAFPSDLINKTYLYTTTSLVITLYSRRIALLQLIYVCCNVISQSAVSF